MHFYPPFIIRLVMALTYDIAAAFVIYKAVCIVRKIKSNQSEPLQKDIALFLGAFIILIVYSFIYWLSK